jgi:DNA-directed RNA polymerase specialized sigma24 family protein
MDSPQGYLFRTALEPAPKPPPVAGQPSGHILQATPSPDPAEVVQSRDSLARALASLPTGQREAVVLVEWPATRRTPCQGKDSTTS